MMETASFLQPLRKVNPSLNNVWKNSFIVTDVETTGHHAENNRITEIACVVVEGGEIIAEFDSLVNPKQSIPPFISKMTGISNEMAFNAPDEALILPEVEKFLNRDKSVFVAHNVEFDWNFVSRSFNRNGITSPMIPRLCTYKLSKALLPNQQKKNVGALADYFNIRIKNRHRALADAKATAKILIELIHLAEQNHNIYTLDDLIGIQRKRSQSFKMNNPVFQKLKRKILDIPRGPGIYKYYDEGNKLIYVGKSNNLYERVSSYFTNGSLNTRKMQELVNSIDNIEWIETNSELSALIYENKLIESEKPYFNKIHKESKKYPFIKITRSELFPKVEMSYQFTDDGSEYFGPFRNSSFAERLINIIDNNFNLIKCQLPPPSGAKIPCTYYRIGKCKAPCINNIQDISYNFEVDSVSNFLNGISDNLIGKLELKMNDMSENFDYENAAKIRDDIEELKKIYKSFKNSPVSLNNNNYIFININSKKDKLIDLFFIKSGRLFYEITVDAKQNLNFIKDDIILNYFTNNNSEIRIEFIEEIRIINSWINKNSDKGEIINIENSDPEYLFNKINSSVKNFHFN